MLDSRKYEFKRLDCTIIDQLIKYALELALEKLAHQRF